ncbi:MAG: hypothetical protein KC910_37380, partial [Candidatus Eremiobacteraeota bacterium]|nr:hypothetical protein [Candidatus Eremiobacteraeota bacterium]
MTEAKFEQFSAWLDGYEQAPEGEWDQASQALQQLGDELRQEQALPKDFAAATAARVLATVPVPWLLRRVWSPKPVPFACLSLSTVAMPWLASMLGRPWQLGLALGVLWF